MNAIRSVLPVIFVIGLCVYACSENPANSDPAVCKGACDTCDNLLAPPPIIDFWPKIPSVAWYSGGKISPDGRYIVFEAGNSDYSNYPERRFPETGLVIYNLQTEEVVEFLDGFFISWDWSIKSDCIFYLRSSLSIISQIDIPSNNISAFPELGLYEYLTVSPSGRYLFASGGIPGVTKFGVVRVDLETKNWEFIAELDELHGEFMVINDTLLCNLVKQRDSVYYYNTQNKCLWSEPFVKQIKWEDIGSHRDISPDCRYIVFDPVGNAANNDGYVDAGVWIIDLTDNKFKQILSRHLYYLFYDQRPSWSSNSTIVATWFCKRDSVELLYEYSLAGKPLRKLVSRNLRFWD